VLGAASLLFMENAARPRAAAAWAATLAGHGSDPEVIRSEMAEAGYRLRVSHEFLPVQSFHVFEPVASLPERRP